MLIIGAEACLNQCGNCCLPKSWASCHNPKDQIAVKRLQWINQNLFQIDLVWLARNSAWSSVPCALCQFESQRASGWVVIASCWNGAACSLLRMLGKTRKPWPPNWLVTVNFSFQYSSLILYSICCSGSCPDGILPLAGNTSIFPQCN